MRRMVDLTGQKFGKLTVIRYADTRNKQPYFVCKCDCGNVVSVRGGSLKYGETSSCGCGQAESRSGFGKRVAKHWVIDGVEYTRAEFIEHFKIPNTTLARRLREGMTVEEIAEIQKKKLGD